MNILGKLIATRRKQLGLQQQQLAARLKNRDEQALSATYLNYIENGRGVPPDYLIEQIAAILKLPMEVLYFWTRRLPPDVVPTEYMDADQIVGGVQTVQGGAQTGHRTDRRGSSPMRVFGEVIAEARRKANLTQRQLAALIKTEEGRGISGPYLNDIEHSLRYPPRGFLLQQFAKVLDLDLDLLYFLAHRMPFDIDFRKVAEERALAAYRVFRQMMSSNSDDQQQHRNFSKRRERASAQVR